MFLDMSTATLTSCKSDQTGTIGSAATGIIVLMTHGTTQISMFPPQWWLSMQGTPSCGVRARTSKMDGKLAMVMAGRFVGHVQRRRHRPKTPAQSWLTSPKDLVNRTLTPILPPLSRTGTARVPDLAMFIHQTAVFLFFWGVFPRRYALRSISDHGCHGPANSSFPGCLHSTTLY